jgi:hypothetical protein
MSVLEKYRQEAKQRQPVELRIRKINEIREKSRAGQRITAEQYENALKPVTSELVKTQDIIRELTNKQQASPIDLLETSPEYLLKTSPSAIQFTPTISYKIPSSIDHFLNNEFTSAVLAKHNLLTSEETNKSKLLRLANISKSLGRKKAGSAGSEREEIDKEINVLQRYRFLLRASQGTGLKHYMNVRELIDRLEILMGQMTAGNDSVDIPNEAIAILDKLLQQKKISQEDHKRLYEKIYSF